MNLQEIKSAVRAGKKVYHQTEDYQVVLSTKNGQEQWLIKCTANNYCIGLTWTDEVTLNGTEDEFFLAKTDKQEEFLDDQLQVIQDMQASGFNVVECGSCGSTILVNKSKLVTEEGSQEYIIYCGYCDQDMADSDCPDFHY